MSDNVQDSQASQSGWTRDSGAGQGNAARLDELGMFDGVDPTGGADAGQAKVAAMIDQALPVGLGCALSGEFALTVGATVGIGGGITVMNAGGGFADISATMQLGLGMGVGEGVKLGNTGEKLEGSVEGSGTVEMTVRFPYLAALSTLEIVAEAVSSGRIPAVSEVLRWIGDQLAGVDLEPYVLEQSVGLEGGGGADGGVGVLGQELSAMLEGVAGVEASIAWEGLPDDRGHREGEVTLTGSIGALEEVAVNLTAFGIDCVFPTGVTGSLSLVVPLSEDGGILTYGVPYCRVSTEGVFGCLGGSVTAEGGPGHALVALGVEFSVGDAPFTAIMGSGLSMAVEACTLGVAELNQESTLSASFEVPLPAELMAALPSPAMAVARFLVTGELAPELEAFGPALLASVAATSVKVGAKLSFSVAADGEIGAEAGLGAGVEGSGEAAVVFERDDVSDLLTAPPTPQNVLDWLKGGSGAAVA